MTKVRTILTITIAAAILAAICFWAWQFLGQKPKFLASTFNNREDYQKIFASLPQEQKAEAKAAIVPHHFLAKSLIAGLYNKIASTDAKNIIVISPDHFNNNFSTDTIAISSYLPWNTPFGTVQPQKQILKQLAKSKKIQMSNTAVALEHGIYVEVPFVKKFFPNAEITPLILKNSSSLDKYKQLGRDLGAQSPKDTILIVSSDFSHNKPAGLALTDDRHSIKILENIQTADLLEANNDCKQCLAVMAGFLESSNADFHLADNRNSFDISGESRDSVTSYVTGYYSNTDYAQIIFVGDLMFDRGIRYFASKNNGNSFIFQQISSLLKSSDLAIANLEGPITDNKSVSSNTIPGSPNNYIFTFDPSVARTLFENNIRVVGLNNNHIQNFESAGIDSTQNYLDENNIAYFGAPDRNRSIIKNISGIKTAFVAYNDFYWNKEAEAQNTINEIKEMKAKADIVIVVSHWGVEYSTQPVVAQKELAHRFVDAGADLVIGSHPHVVQPTEQYNGKRIYYSLGNFIFDQYFDENVRKGLGVVVKINKATKEIDFKEINFYLQSNGQTIIK